ncbi:hypothetical protein [Nocardia sp. NRRL WC-3656]|uniref:hypothetical protein n=1 Tax=Nocardia sp. NRRL WC-3656 TaxID=1463824 RepID=UPI0004C2FD63|nr:hypothetical protein [Nocardia sp. NRRL WC-3656]
MTVAVDRVQIGAAIVDHRDDVRDGRRAHLQQRQQIRHVRQSHGRASGRLRQRRGEQDAVGVGDDGLSRAPRRWIRQTALDGVEDGLDVDRCERPWVLAQLS